MTTKTTTATVPVLGHPQCDNEDDFALFADHLARWCAQYVPTIGVPVMRRARDLYNETAICILLGEWYDLKLEKTKDMHDRLLRAANGDEFSWETEGGDDEFSDGSTYVLDRVRGYNDALYALLVK